MLRSDPRNDEHAVAKTLAKSFQCASEFTLAVLAGKWKTGILCYLGYRPFRYGELRKLMPQLSDKVLTERLRDLAVLGLVAHRPAGAGRRPGSYTLTSKGHLLDAVLRHIHAWGLENAQAFGVKVGDPMKGLRAGNVAHVSRQGATKFLRPATAHDRAQSRTRRRIACAALRRP